MMIQDFGGKKSMQIESNFLGLFLGKILEGCQYLLLQMHQPTKCVFLFSSLNTMAFFFYYSFELKCIINNAPTQRSWEKAPNYLKEDLC